MMKLFVETGKQCPLGYLNADICGYFICHWCPRFCKTYPQPIFSILTIMRRFV
jgi:hypothetical protein